MTSGRRCATCADRQRRRAGRVVADVDALWSHRLLPFEENTRLADGLRDRGGAQLVDPQPRWATDARRLAARVVAAAGGARVDHIGSTAIPAMPAKDVIDLQLTVPGPGRRGCVGGAAWPPRDFRRSTGIEQDTPHPADDDPGPLAQATARQRRPRAKSQPPREGEGFGRAGAGRCCSGTGCRADRVGRQRSTWRRSGPLGGACGRPDPTRYALTKEPWMAQAYPAAWPGREPPGGRPASRDRRD